MKRSSKQQNKKRHRGLFEQLEVRRLLTSDWQNPNNRFNVDNDSLGGVGIEDAILVVTELRNRSISDAATGAILREMREPSEPYLDVDGDGFISPIDLVQLLNHFAEPASDCALDSQALSLTMRESASFVTTCVIPLEVDDTLTVDKISFRIDVQPDAREQPSPDLLIAYLHSADDPTMTTIDRGMSGTSFFSLRNGDVEFPVGLVRFTGNRVEVNVSEIEDLHDKVLGVQLIDLDGIANTTATISDIEFVEDPDAMILSTRSVTDVLAPGPEIDLATWMMIDELEVDLDNVRFNETTDTLDAELRVINRGPECGGCVSWTPRVYFF